MSELNFSMQVALLLLLFLAHAKSAVSVTDTQVTDYILIGHSGELMSKNAARSNKAQEQGGNLAAMEA